MIVKQKIYKRSSNYYCRLRVKVLGKDVGALRTALEPKVRVTF